MDSPSSSLPNDQDLFLEGCCPYCSDDLSNSQLHIHLHTCLVYNDIISQSELVDISSS